MTERRWLDGITDAMDIGLSRLQEMMMNREDTCLSPLGCKELDTSE